MMHSPKYTARRGQVAPLTALLIVPIIGMMAFSIDLGYAVVVNTQLQNAADAAALAGAQQLMDPNVAYFTPGNSSDQQRIILSNGVSSATKTAKAVANYNTAGAVNVGLLDADISVGYLDSAGTFTSYTSLASGTFPNTVRVTARRDSSSNGVLKLFFGRVFGRDSISMSCFAQASNYVVDFTGVNSITQNLAVLPLAYDRSTWKDILYQNVQTTQNANDSNGDRLMHIYPLPGNSTNSGAFGYLSLNDSSVNANDLTNWINNGLSPTDLSAVKSNGLFPLPAEGSDTSNWQGAPGFKNTDVDLINSLDTTKTYLLPLFKAYSGDGTYAQNSYNPGLGQGSNNYYDIRDFVSVKLVPTGNTHKDIYVRPSPMTLNADQIFGSTSLAGGNSTSSDGYTINTVFVAPRLSQ